MSLKPLVNQFLDEKIKFGYVLLILSTIIFHKKKKIKPRLFLYYKWK